MEGFRRAGHILFIQSACEVITVIIRNILNQVRAVWLAWGGFLEITCAHVDIDMFVCVCVCPLPMPYITSGVIWAHVTG